MIALLASLLLSTNATPHELVASCRSMIPANVELSGRIILRNRKGIPQAEHGYVLSRSNSVPPHHRWRPLPTTHDQRPTTDSQHRRHLERLDAGLSLVG